MRIVSVKLLNNVGQESQFNDTQSSSSGEYYQFNINIHFKVAHLPCINVNKRLKNVFIQKITYLTFSKHLVFNYK